VSTASSVQGINQKIEDVRTFAGQTATLSFWAKAASNTTVTAIISRVFGSGGSSPADVGDTSFSVTTDWQRFSFTLAIPSIAGKTIGTSSFLNVRLLNLTNSTFTLDIWGVQLEAGAVATPFKRNAPSIQAELATCQRYFERIPSLANITGFAAGTNLIYCRIRPTQTMRIPLIQSTFTVNSGTVGWSDDYASDGTASAISLNSVPAATATTNGLRAYFTLTQTSGSFTTGRFYSLSGSTGTATVATIDLNAEL
jgi:hypothetical protein